MAMMAHRRFMPVLAVAAMSLAGCGGDDSTVRTVTVSAEPDQADSVVGDAILIETLVSDARNHTGEVLGGSFIGHAAFCPGGKLSGGGDEEGVAAAITTFNCPEGRLTIRFSPQQPDSVQSAVWDVVSGTGSFKGLRGGGTMVARFGTKNRDRGRETFTGTIGE